MKNTACSGIFINYDRSVQSLIVLERRVSESGDTKDRTILRFSFADYDDRGSQIMEQTLGQLVLHSLEKLTPGGLGFGDYGELLDRISDENIAAFSQELDLSDPDDQYGLALYLFSRGTRMKSWEIVERAIGLYESAAAGGHFEAKRFLNEDLPIVRPRLEEQLKHNNPRKAQ